MRGNFRKKKAKITSSDLKGSRIILEGIQRSKKDGTKVNVYFHPSSLQIQSLNIEDNKRLAHLTKNEPFKESKQDKKLKEKKDAPKEAGSAN